MENAPRILAILAILDTREWVEEGDRWVALPGSGQERRCDRCDRLHEVHATVLLETGATATVGTGCMRAESAEIQKAIRRGVRAAKKARREAFEAQKRDALAVAYEAAQAKVEAMEPPDDVTLTVESLPDGDITVLRMGDAEVWHLRPTLTKAERAERMDALVRAWREKRLAELGIGFQHRAAYRARARA